MSSAPLTRTDGTPVRVLVVDDEVALAQAIGLAFTADGWSTHAVHRGRDVLFAAREFQPDVVVLDVMLPDIDGFEVLSRLRDARDDARVLFLTAKDAHEDRIAGLTGGGDDYLTKPFGIEELLVRARILARTSSRVVADGGPARLVVEDLELDEDTHAVTRGGEGIDLTATEFELLRYMMRNARRVLTRDRILTNVWGMDFGASSNLVDMYVSYLRRKVDAGREPLLQTVRGTGYVLRPPT
ncbi:MULTISPECIES: response regulator transcription factor [unclassified Curtobacterium]|uniref:response regulator transcription factor n=1 Tax=unclassified Curtobacterium TaxID=257496 RepID=UPI000DA818D8|nr:MULTISPECIES: response regulator transcription factor [unclassified Curtobacterium]PZE30036.1 DNA-binding response regulator [Curtobacterium sp. MCBD17_028]PZE76677.1 DNA-binding response regulator [Curtobacterium sp. MCBD17_019]PZF61087.1 DNA-binding response regulator [Curtobacterium sp. MCBD17_034]PZM40437.1 DNA-binding response regulator [Curtobacterium sp. MCBD17_031]